jgi:hypothetical protein
MKSRYFSGTCSSTGETKRGVLRYSTGLMERD